MHRLGGPSRGTENRDLLALAACVTPGAPVLFYYFTVIAFVWCPTPHTHTAVAYYPPQSVVVRLWAPLRVAFGKVGSWKLTLDILHPPAPV